MVPHHLAGSVSAFKDISIHTLTMISKQRPFAFENGLLVIFEWEAD